MVKTVREVQRDVIYIWENMQKKVFLRRSIGEKASNSDEKGMENETGIHTNLKNIVRKCKGSVTSECSRQIQGKIIGFPDKVENKDMVVS